MRTDAPKQRNVNRRPIEKVERNKVAAHVLEATKVSIKCERSSVII